MPANASSLLRSFGFLALALFLGARACVELIAVVPPIGELYLELWRALMPILGNAFFGIEGPILIETTGSGDMTWNYVETFWLVVAALLGAGAWLGLRRRDLDIGRIHAWLRVLLRYWLALVLWGYGFAKLLGGQFSPPEPLRLLTSYGESSPMGLLWTFMGFSPTYMHFTGLAEALAAALLLTRRTTTLGALLAIAVLTNVVLLNFCFDVPVKLYSSTLLLTAIVLAAPDLRRLVSAFLLNQPVGAVDLSQPALTGRVRVAARIGRALFGLLLVVLVALGALVGNSEPEEPWAPFLGVHEVDTLTIDGAERPPLLTDATRWRRIYLSPWGFAAIERMSGGWIYYSASYDAEAHRLTLLGHQPEAKELALDVAVPGEGRLTFRGTSTEGALQVELHELDLSTQPLTSRGFRWIQEYPYNR